MGLLCLHGKYIYASNNKASKYMKQELIELKGEIGNFTIIIGDFSTSLLVIRRTTGQEICKNIKKTEQYHQPLDLIHYL